MRNNEIWPFQGYLVNGSNQLFISCQFGFDPKTGNLTGGGVRAETKLTLSNIKAILEAAGAEIK